MRHDDPVNIRGKRRWAPASLVLVVASALLGGALAAPANAATGRVISGRVVNADGQGIEGITVIANRYNKAEQQWRDDAYAVTGVDGTYSVAAARTGSYKLQFRAEAFISNQYAPTWYPGTEVMSNAKVIQISTSSVHHIDVTMKVGGVVSGRVFQPDGTPAPTGTSVLAFPTSSDPDQISGDWGSLWTTVQGGYYSFPGLRAGSYRIRSDPNPLHGAPTWFGQTSYFNTATPVTVALGEETSGNDITLSVPGTMGGRVLHPKHANSKPPVHIAISDKYRHHVAWVETDAYGRWSLAGVAPGQYYLAFSAANMWRHQWYGPSDYISGAKLVTVESGATTTVDNRLVYSSMKSLSRPEIIGTRKVGHYLEPRDGSRWNHTPSYFIEQWYRDGVRIPGARYNAYRLRSADTGHRISLRLTAVRHPYENGSAMSAPTATIRK